MDEQKTLRDILEIVNFIKDNAASKDDVLSLASEVSTNTAKIDTMGSEISTIQSDLKQIRATMVTKAYLDDKLADLRGDLTILMRKEDTKLKALVEILFKKDHISDEDKKKLYSLEPFPSLS